MKFKPFYKLNEAKKQKISSTGIKYVYHVTRLSSAKNILEHNYFRVSKGTIDLPGLSTTFNKNYNWGTKEVKFVLDLQKLRKDYDLYFVDEELNGLKENEIKICSKDGGPILNAKKYIIKIICEKVDNDFLKLAKELDVEILNKESINESVQTLESFQETLLKKYPLEHLRLYKKDSDLILDMIAINKSERKQGIGSKVLEEICDYADQNHLRILLTTAVKDTYHGTTSMNRLKSFYKKFGFVENKGRNKDFTTSHNMIRKPIL